jgi:integrase
MNRNDVLRMIKRRARQAGLPDRIGCHTFRATGITAYMLNGGKLEHACHSALQNRTALSLCCVNHSATYWIPGAIQL